MTTSTLRRDRDRNGQAGGSGRRLQRSRLRLADVLRLGGTGIRARPTRAFLSALGIAIGIAAMISVVGISASSRAQLAAQLPRQIAIRDGRIVGDSSQKEIVHDDVYAPA